MAQQTHVVDPALLHQAVADKTQTDQQNRDVVLGVLHQSGASDVADRLGLSLTGAESAVSTLSSTELASLADTVRTSDAPMAGGNDRIVISTTTLLIIVLLVLLLTR